MRSRLRKLHVDGRTFTWKADIRDAFEADGRHRCIRVRVWGAGKNGRALQADLTEWPHPPTPWDERYAYPTAENVRELARYALSVGWTPEAVGGTFRITSGAKVALPGLAVTDLLSTAERPH
ncbi:hypothetical protein GCM10009848_61130 [Micromonospora lupini]